MAAARAADADLLAPFRDARLGYIDTYRRTGILNQAVLAQPQAQLERLTEQAAGEAKAAALIELGTIRRLRNDFAGAAVAYQRAAAIAGTAGRSDLLFDAEIGTARAYGFISEHRKAADALERARAAAEAEPDQAPKQRHDLAAYDAQLLDGRGELEAALAKALVARRLATTLPTEADSARFYAAYDLANILRHLAERCDYTTIEDDQSADDGPNRDGYEGCRRAVTQASQAFREAVQIANYLRWAKLAAQTQEQDGWLANRRFLIDRRASAQRLRLSTAFSPHVAADVLVNQNFEAGASTLEEWNKLFQLLNGQLAASEEAGYGPNPRREYLRGLERDMAGDHDGALRHFQTGAAALGDERSGFFDPRRRGTVTENRGEIMRDVALRLLSFGRLDEAFDVFESMRARGLDEVRAALAASRDPGDRDWLGRLLLTEATLSGIHSGIARRTIAFGPDALHNNADLDKAAAAEANRATLLSEPGAAERRERLGANTADRPRLADLQQAAQASGTAIVLFWVVETNILVWHVGPEPGSTWVRTVFLPRTLLQSLVDQVRDGLESDDKTFDTVAAQRLYLFLIGSLTEPRDIGRDGKVVRPSTRQPALGGPRIMFVPQGELLKLPFEVLIDPQGRYLIERWETSYAPNATEAVRSLRQDAAVMPARVTFVVGSDLVGTEDAELDQIIQAVGAANVAPVNTSRLGHAAFVETAAGAAILHVYAHGKFTPNADPLLSWLSGVGSDRFTAAELVGIPVRDPDPRRLVVFSSCEGAKVQERISNEIFGFAWALLVSGTPRAVIARWSVSPAPNAEWMGHFYASLAQGRSPAAAAAAAMRAMRAMPPRDWAAMQVIGG